jgi:hypothetical protein
MDQNKTLLKNSMTKTKYFKNVRTKTKIPQNVRIKSELSPINERVKGLDNN